MSGVPDSSFTNYAWGVDAQWGKPGDEGLYALAEYLEGDDASAGQAPDARHAGRRRLQHPDEQSHALALRGRAPVRAVDLADPDTDTDDDGATVITAGVGVYMSSKAWFRIAYEREDFQAATRASISGIRSMLAVSF